jgi:hypothetical protein
MNSKENQSKHISQSINLPVEDLIADSQANADHSEVQRNDLPHQITSTPSIVDQNLENSEKLNFTHKENFGNFDLQNIKDNEEIFQNIDDLSKQIRDIHLEYFSEETRLENKNSEILKVFNPKRTVVFWLHVQWSNHPRRHVTKILRRLL